MEFFWSESIWCPENVKWSDFRPDSAQFHHLYYAGLTAGALLFIRFLCENFLFHPLGASLCRQPIEDKGAGDQGTKYKRAKQRTVNKFSEGLWRLTFYLAAAIYGWFFVLWDKPYLSNTMYAFYDYPNHPVTSDEWWYYNIELGFYLSLLITQFVDTKRSDFWQMFVHHIVTILLIVLSWACNFQRIGAIVLAIHDIADVPLEGAKLAKYCNWQRLADVIFAIFTITWTYTRCYLLPTKVIYYTSYKALSIIPFFPAYYIFNGLLCLLQLLHIAWTVLIIRMVFDALQNDGMRDLRSEDEDSEASHVD